MTPHLALAVAMIGGTFAFAFLLLWRSTKPAPSPFHDDDRGPDEYPGWGSP